MAFSLVYPPLSVYLPLRPYNLCLLPWCFFSRSPRDEEMGVGIGLGKIREMGEGVIELREVIGDQNF